MQEFSDLANNLADEAGNIIKQYFRQPLDVENKDDTSPVTIADRKVEQRLREIIEKHRPEDGILGEEFGNKESQSGLTWVLDPIDGTKPFLIGRPTFGTLIALCEEEKPVLGLIDQPILEERWLGIKGETTKHNGKPAKTRECKNLQNAMCGSTSPGMFKTMTPDFIQIWRDACNFIVWGGDCYMYGLLANGHMDVIIEAEMQVYDYLAHVPVIEGAGGKISDWNGNPLTLTSGHHVVALGEPSLWGDVSKLLK